ncbi:MAG TPA: methyltransferase domain-containing protein [Candidatus Nanopelagicales bacterium]
MAEATARRVLLFGSYDVRLHPRVAVLRDGLATRGWAVEELNAPLGASTADKVAAAGSAGAALDLVGKQLRAWRRLVRERAAVAPHPDVVVVGYLGHADVHLARALFPRATLVLDHLVGLADTVRDRGLATGPRARGLQAVDAAALRVADLVVVDTPEQAAVLPDWARGKAVVVPVGAGAAWFDAGTAQADRRPGPVLRVVFVGLFTPLQGTATIARALVGLADDPIEVTLVGTGQDHDEVRRILAGHPHITWLDWVDASELPALVAEHDVCLGVFGAGPKAQRVVPTKVYQGLAAGCAVITGDTPAATALGDAVLRVPPADPEALAARLRQLATDQETLSMARHRARTGATAYSPHAVTAGLDERLAATPARRPAPPPLTFNAWLRWDLITRELAALPAGDVLEIGPGEGAAACRLAVGRAYTGVELSDRTRAITAQRLAAQGTPGRLLASLDELGADEQFDLVCAFEVIEHIEDDAAALAAWAARVRPGGALILSTPAGPDRMGAADRIAGHFRRYDPAALGDMAGAVGLVDVRVRHVGFPFGYALEAVRNAVAARRLADQQAAAAAARAASPDAALAEFTEGSSSFLQPPAWSGPATRIASAPGRWMQRRVPDRGPGLVLVARAR